jgi:2Fe-2S ferredoxin
MPKLFVTTRAGEVREIEVDVGTTAMEAIRNAGVFELLALCGGCCSCATCHVFVDPRSGAELNAMNEDEDMLLDGSSHRRETSRLSCQIRMDERLSGLKVEIAPED